MAEKLIDVISQPIFGYFKSKSKMFDLFKELDTGPEDWFRIEILKVIRDLSGISILATNQKYEDIPGRPDFVLCHNGSKKIVELKVLPKDRNYNSGYQRFCAVEKNKKDFDALSNDEVDTIIYIYWPDPNGFDETRKRLENRYPAVSCYRQEAIKLDNYTATISFWIKANGNSD